MMAPNHILMLQLGYFYFCWSCSSRSSVSAEVDKPAGLELSCAKPSVFSWKQLLKWLICVFFHLDHWFVIHPIPYWFEKETVLWFQRCVDPLQNHGFCRVWNIWIWEGIIYIYHHMIVHIFIFIYMSINAWTALIK